MDPTGKQVTLPGVHTTEPTPRRDLEAALQATRQTGRGYPSVKEDL
jgi:hypothetical protein